MGSPCPDRSQECTGRNHKIWTTLKKFWAILKKNLGWFENKVSRFFFETAELFLCANRLEFVCQNGSNCFQTSPNSFSEWPACVLEIGAVLTLCSALATLGVSLGFVLGCLTKCVCVCARARVWRPMCTVPCCVDCVPVSTQWPRREQRCHEAADPPGQGPYEEGPNGCGWARVRPADPHLSERPAFVRTTHICQKPQSFVKTVHIFFEPALLAKSHQNEFQSNPSFSGQRPGFCSGGSDLSPGPKYVIAAQDLHKSERSPFFFLQTGSNLFVNWTAFGPFCTKFGPLSQMWARAHASKQLQADSACHHLGIQISVQF